MQDRQANFIHEMLMHDLEQAEEDGEEFAVLKLDIWKCFDTVFVDMALLIWEHFGAPPQVLHVLKHLYFGNERWLEKDGQVHPEPICPFRSLMQGCPASMMLLAGVMTVWYAWVRTPGLEIGVLVDDRTMWAAGRRAYDYNKMNNLREKKIIKGCGRHKVLFIHRNIDNDTTIIVYSCL